MLPEKPKYGWMEWKSLRRRQSRPGNIINTISVITAVTCEKEVICWKLKWKIARRWDSIMGWGLINRLVFLLSVSIVRYVPFIIYYLISNIFQINHLSLSHAFRPSAWWNWWKVVLFLIRVKAYYLSLMKISNFRPKRDDSADTPRERCISTYPSGMCYI